MDFCVTQRSYLGFPGPCTLDPENFAEVLKAVHSFFE